MGPLSAVTASLITLVSLIHKNVPLRLHKAIVCLLSPAHFSALLSLSFIPFFFLFEVYNHNP